MRALVTGAAGFVGSHLCEHLLASGDEVVAIDSFTDYYRRRRKQENLAAVRQHGHLSFIEGDLAEIPLEPFVDGVDVVYHLAGQPGVRGSWGPSFDHYVKNNVQLTQRLLEAVMRTPVRAFVYASSSSVYGNAATLPTPETACPRPVSPYGVTKLAAEHLCELYRTAYGVPTVSLRFFTVYGPRQRPDMAFARLVEAAVRGSTFELYGDGRQSRDFTYVQDVVETMRVAALSGWHGVANLGGGTWATMNDVIGIVREVCGPVEVRQLPVVAGDARHTGADTTVARQAFRFAPAWRLEQGIESMDRWARQSQLVAR